jgi:hypothetical protein
MSTWRRNVRYRLCKRILVIVLLMSFWKNPVYGEPPTTQETTSNESGMRLYSDSEIDVLIEDLTVAAEEAIERAAAEAARAATLVSLEREAVAIQETQRLQGENSRLKQSRIKTAVICFLSGLVIGTGGILILQGGR